MLSSGSNIVKYHRINLNDEDARIIDSNELMAAKIAALTQSLQESVEEDEEGDFAEDFSDGIEATQVSMLLDSEASNVIKAAPVYDGPSPEELIEEAKAEIEKMMLAAQNEAEQIKNQAFEEGKTLGYQEGAAMAQREADAMIQNMSAELAQKEEQLTRVFQQKIEEVEPVLVDVLTNIYEHIFAVDLSDNRDLILHLIANALQKTDGSSAYIIHVSADDLPFVSMNKEALMEECGITNATFDVIEDVTLKSNQCLVETENGIFDCSLGVELKELKKQLILLAYDGIA